MAQVTIYLEQGTEAKMRSAAKAENLSQSKWIANIIKEKVTDQWPDSVKAAAGTWDEFPSLQEIRGEVPADSHREQW
jgi:hypothetical protein